MTMNLEEDVKKGGRAKQILDDPIMQEVYETMTLNLLDMMADAHQDVDALKHIALTRKVLDNIFSMLQDFADTGRMAAMQIETELQARQNKH